MSSEIQNDDVVIKVDHVSKCFEMYANPRHRLQQMMFGKMLNKQWYREFWALKDVSFDICRGECVGIIGRNGSGKSTILQIITGTLPATEGSVTIKPDLRIAALLELGSGFNPEFTGRDNVYMNASILGLTKEETDKAMPEIEKFADIGEFIDQPVKAYSSGMMVRLAFAVQIMVKPDILIVDEALAVGDAFFQQKCYERIRELRAGGCTILFVSHDNMTVRSLCDKAVFLKKGKLVAIGPSSEVCMLYFKGGQLSGDSIQEQAQRLAQQLDFDVVNSSAKSPFRIDPALAKRASDISGNGEAEFTSFDFYDDIGERIDHCETGDVITAAVSFRVKKDLPAGSCLGILVMTDKG